MSNAEIKTLASPLSLRDLGVFSVEGTKRIILCALLPIVLFLSHAALGYLVPSQLTSYLPILALVSLGSIIYFRGIGLVLAVSFTLVTFLLQGAVSQDFWHVLQLLSLSLSWGVAHLCFTEIRSTYENLNQQLNVQKEQVTEITQRYEQEQVVWEERREALEAEIARLIEEAEQRRLESEQQVQYSLLMRSEIDLLTSQKEQILRSEQIAQEALALKDEELKNFQSVYCQLDNQVMERQQLESEYHLRIQEHKEQCEQLTQQLLEQQKIHARQLEQLQNTQAEQQQDLQLTRQLEEVKASYEQKLHVLQHAHAQQVEELKRRCDRLQVEQESSIRHMQQLEEIKSSYEQQLNALKQEHTQQIEELQHHQNQTLQEQNAKLEQQIEALQIVQAEQVCEGASQIHRELAKVEGLHKQLRAQFEEKSRVLDQTRRQLFKVEGELELAQREHKNSLLEESLDQDSQSLIKALMVLQEELNEAEQQIQDLESLMTQCFHSLDQKM